MSDEPAGNSEAAGATKPRDESASNSAAALARKDELSETPAFSPGLASFSGPAGSTLVATETASAGEAPVTAMATGEEMATGELEIAPATEDAADEWDDRQLCVDGGCVGVLDETGVCRVCGKVDPNFKAPVCRPVAASRSNVVMDDDYNDDEGATGNGASSGGSGDEWDDRKLCEDGACIGVMVAGRCNICGRVG